jgi:hypothetical protein
MTTLSVTRDEATRVDQQAPLSDAESAAQAALVGAISFTSQKMHLNRAEVAIALKQNDHETYGYFKYGLAAQVAEHVAGLDPLVKSVYLYDDEATPEDEVFGECQPSRLIHLLVVAKRKTEALNALIGALDRALVRGFAGLANAPHLAHLLDVQVVDETEVQSRLGYAALLSSIHHQPLPILER